MDSVAAGWSAGRLERIEKMGNRAVITTSRNRKSGVGIYIHWNGGLESVLAFLDAARDRGYSDPEHGPEYAMARLCGLMCEFFEGEGGIGIGPLSSLDTDNGDNGVYVIGEGWTIIKRWGAGHDIRHKHEHLSVEEEAKRRLIAASLLGEEA